MLNASSLPLVSHPNSFSGANIGSANSTVVFYETDYTVYHKVALIFRKSVLLLNYCSSDTHYLVSVRDS